MSHFVFKYYYKLFTYCVKFIKNTFWPSIEVNFNKPIYLIIFKIFASRPENTVGLLTLLMKGLVMKIKVIKNWLIKIYLYYSSIIIFLMYNHIPILLTVFIEYAIVLTVPRTKLFNELKATKKIYYTNKTYFRLKSKKMTKY